MPEALKPLLAFDLGAETGRAVLAHIHSGVITTDEIHRFANEPVHYAAQRPGFASSFLAVSGASGSRNGKVLARVQANC
jgi:hypothetical protein